MASTSFGQWQAIRLHPDGYLESAVYGVSQGRQAGYFRQTSYADQPVVWNGTASSAVALAPPSASEGSDLYGISGSTQVGIFATSAPTTTASLWTGVPGSRVDLNPAGASSSTAVGCSGNEQVGYAYINNNDHAGIWHGSAPSWVDLHPATIARRSFATATNGTNQAGYVELLSTGYDHAAMWSGTAASFVDMNPPSASGSGILGITGNQQAGAMSFPGSLNEHAALWFGTPQSAIDLHPAQSGTGYSDLLATDGVFQVGVASIGTFGHAGIWHGTAASFLDLHALLPPGYVSSSATSVDEYQGQTWVGGYATNSLGNREAFLWVSVPAPASCGLLIFGALFAARRRPR
jgi:hypothetical protein